MVNFFEFIINFLESIGTVITLLIESLLTAITVLTNAITIPVYLIPFLPTIISSCVLCVVSICVIKFLLGR